MGMTSKRKVVYIAHPISGDVYNNCQKVVRIVEAINRKKPNVQPFAPYIVDLLALNNKKEEDKELGMMNNLELIRRGFVDELWVFGDKISKGMKQEIDIARENNIPVKIKDEKDYEYTTGN